MDKTMEKVAMWFEKTSMAVATCETRVLPGGGTSGDGLEPPTEEEVDGFVEGLLVGLQTAAAVVKAAAADGSVPRDFGHEDVARALRLWLDVRGEMREVVLP